MERASGIGPLVRLGSCPAVVPDGRPDPRRSAAGRKGTRRGSTRDPIPSGFAHDGCPGRYTDRTRCGASVGQASRLATDVSTRLAPLGPNHPASPFARFRHFLTRWAAYLHRASSGASIVLACTAAFVRGALAAAV